MSDPVAPKLNPLPFLAGDALLIGVAWLILQNSAKPLGLWQMGALAGCVALGAWCSFIPFLKRYETEAKLVESQNLQTAVAQIQKVETLAEHIQNATAQWQTVQELSSKTNETAQQITRRISEESRAFNEFLQKANDVEKSHLRLEVEKLRRSEGDWLQVLVRIFDHVFALHAAAVHSGQPKLVEQLGGFQNACLDVARRVGLVPFGAEAGETFDGEKHQLPDSSAPPDASTIGETVAAGFTFQGQLLRRAVVTLPGPADQTVKNETASIREDEVKGAPIGEVTGAAEEPAAPSAPAGDLLL